MYGEANLAEAREESGEARIFMSFADEADLVVDVGAHVGVFTLLARSRGVPVVAIEPSPRNLIQLYRNLQLNGDADVEVMPVAVGDHVGLAQLFGEGGGASLLSSWAGQSSNLNATTTPLHTLDGLLSARSPGKKLLIKIDTEGSELPVLRGAERLLRNDPAPAWMVEIWLTETFGGEVNPDFRAIFETFWRFGYTATCVEAGGRPVVGTDVETWIARGDRGFWNIDYLFQKSPG